MAQTVKVIATKIEDKIELDVDAFDLRKDNFLQLKACRIRFKEAIPYVVDTVGDGLLTMSMDQAKTLNDQLTEILKGDEDGTDS